VSAPYWQDDQVTLFHGDCLEVLVGMAAASIDAIVTDPPYGLEFMGAEWDGANGFRRSLNPADAERDSVFGRASRTGPEYRTGKPAAARLRTREDGRTNPREGKSSVTVPESYVAGNLYQQWCGAWARECLRVLKPGAYMLAMGGSRTWHRLACAVEDAGFEIRDTITWHYGAGFPKNRDVSKDLRTLPACTCGDTGLRGESVSVVEPVSPAGPVGAGVGAEAAPVTLAGEAADGTRGVGADVGTDPAHAFADVQGRIIDGSRNGLPIVLGPPAMAIGAEGDEVGEVVRFIKADPEPLRDQVVGDEPVSCPAVGAAPISGDDLLGDSAPSDSLIFPLPASPSGIALTTEPAAVGNGHAVPRAVDGDSRPVADSAVTAHSAGEGLHNLKCKACGGVRRHLIPDGLGTALKPATEFIVVARKPLAGTVAANVLEHGTGALNIAGCRVGTGTSRGDRYNGKAPGGSHGDGLTGGTREEPWQTPAGRWPPNVLLTHAEGCEWTGTRKVRGSRIDKPSGPLPGDRDTYGRGLDGARPARGIGDADGMETVESWNCAEGCPVAEMDAQSGSVPSSGAYAKGSRAVGAKAGAASIPLDGLAAPQYTDSGGASRFFPVFRYQAKAPKKERPVVDGVKSHPTVKPLALMQWLVRLVTPPGGVVLDPFAGTGTTLQAARLEGFRSIGIDSDPDSVTLACERLGIRIDDAA
jgi:DNA modification methylase